MRFLLLIIMAMFPGMAAAKSAIVQVTAESPATEGARCDRAESPAEGGDPEEAEMLDKFDVLGPLMSEIGVEGALAAGGKADGLFIYVEMHGADATVLVFRDRGKTVKLYAATERLRQLVTQAWMLEPPGKRWLVLAFEVNGRKFDTRFLYSAQVDFEKSFQERLDALMPDRFEGKKLYIDRKDPVASEGEGEASNEADAEWAPLRT